MVDTEEVLNLPTKKKKKKPINIDELLEPTPNLEAKQAAGSELAIEEELDLTKKKKKKKKKTGFTLEGEEPNKENGDLTSSVPADDIDASSKQKSKLSDGNAVADNVADLGDEFDETLQLSGKKKKKRDKALLDGKQVSFLEPNQALPADDANLVVGDQKWSGTDRDYSYEELLTRVFDIMRRKNPEMVAGEKKRFIMKPPQCARVGTKKTSFVNFNEICQMLHRQPKHVLAFILAELGASGSVDGNNQLIIKGRFQQKQLESVLRRYIKEYVTCHTCKSPDTLLERDVRLYFLRCRVCQSRCSVAAIKSGFQAVTNKRARLRAKAGP